jgi:hypothetical protein
LCIFDLFHILLELWLTHGSLECMYIYIYIYMCVCVYIYIHICVYVYFKYIYIVTSSISIGCLALYGLTEGIINEWMNEYGYIYIHIHIYVCVCVGVSVFVNMCVCMYIIRYVCIYVNCLCLYIYTYMYIHTCIYIHVCTVSPNQSSRTSVSTAAPYSPSVKILQYKNQIHLTHFVFSPATSTQISWKCKGCSQSSAPLLLSIIIVINASWTNHILQLLNKILMHLIIVPLMKICNWLHNYIWFF